jgi:hypothetical protein
MWRKMHRAIQNGWELDDYLLDYHHTSHCEMRLLDSSLRKDDVNTVIRTKYPSCGTI